MYDQGGLMIWRLLRRSWARIRDLGLLALVADYFLHGLGGWLALTAGIAIASAVTAAMATAAATHAKAVSTENRLNKLVGDVSNTNTSVTNLNTLVNQLNQGIITNGQGSGFNVQIWGSGTLHTGPLAQFDDTTNTTFLSNLKKLNHLSGLPQDNNTGSSWATGERGFINNCVNYINNIDGDLQNKGWMN